MTMREPLVTDFLWYRFKLVHKNETFSEQFCDLSASENSTRSHAKGLNSRFDYIFRIYFVSWMFPALWITGITGITLTLLTIKKHPKVIPSTTRFWFTVLFVVDALVLSVVGIRWWSYTVFETDLRNSNAVLCAAYNYITYLLVHLSGWLQAFIFIERMVVVKAPIVAKKYLRAQKARVCFAGLCLFLLVINTPIPFLTYTYTDFRLSNDRKVLLVCAKWAYMGLKVVGLLDLVVGSIVPLIIMITGSVVLIVALRQSNSRHGSNENCSPLTNGSVGRKHLSARNRIKQKRICRVSLLMNSVYLVTNYPLTMVLLYTSYSDQSTASSTIYVMYSILYLLSFVNNATNWALLTLTGHGYRKKFRHLLTNSCKRTVNKEIDMNQLRRPTMQRNSSSL